LHSNAKANSHTYVQVNLHADGSVNLHANVQANSNAKVHVVNSHVFLHFDMRIYVFRIDAHTSKSHFYHSGLNHTFLTHCYLICVFDDFNFSKPFLTAGLSLIFLKSVCACLTYYRDATNT